MYVYICTYIRILCVYNIDLCPSKRIWIRIFPTQIQPSDIRIQDPLHWSWSILFQVFIKQKSSVLNIFCPSIMRHKIDDRKKWVSYIYVFRHTNSRSDHLIITTNQFLLGFKCFTPLNYPTHYIGRSFFSYLIHGQKVFKTLNFWFIDIWII